MTERMAMIKTVIALSGALFALLAVPVFAGELYGTIYDGAAKLAPGVAVEIACAAKKYPATKTDANGGYHFDVEETGKCALTVHYKGQSPSAPIVAYDEGAQSDFMLRNAGGKYSMKTK